MKLVITEKAKVHQLVAIFRHLNGIVTDVNINLQTDTLYIYRAWIPVTPA